MKYKWRHAFPNLRGQRITFAVDDRLAFGVVITHVRNNCWYVQSPSLPATDKAGLIRRAVLPRHVFTLVQ